MNDSDHVERCNVVNVVVVVVVNELFHRKGDRRIVRNDARIRFRRRVRPEQSGEWYEWDESHELDECHESYEWDEWDESHELNESNECNESYEWDEFDESHELNESNEWDEFDECNELNESNECDEFDESFGSDESRLPGLESASIGALQRGHGGLQHRGLLRPRLLARLRTRSSSSHAGPQLLVFK